MSRRMVLPVSLLRDGRIQCTDYPDWAQARRTILMQDYDRAILDELLRSLPVEGVLEPLTIAVRRHDRAMGLSDGHHRAVALMELGARTFPYRWFWAPAAGRPRFERVPLPADILERGQAA